MPNNRLTVDRPFADQPAAKEILKHSKYLVPKALIPKATLSKIHGLAKQLIIDELGPEKEIVGLRIGYYAPLVESEKVGELYFVELGKLPTADEDHSDSKPNIKTQILSSEFIFQLLQRIREEIIRQTPPIALESRTLHIDFLLAVVKKVNDFRLFSRTLKFTEIRQKYVVYINGYRMCRKVVIVNGKSQYNDCEGYIDENDECVCYN